MQITEKELERNSLINEKFGFSNGVIRKPKISPLNPVGSGPWRGGGGALYNGDKGVTDLTTPPVPLPHSRLVFSLFLGGRLKGPGVGGD